MTTIQEVSGAWSSKMSSLDVPLERGLPIIFASGTVLNKADGTSEPSKKDLFCRLVDWRYRVGEPDNTGLELIVKTEPPKETVVSTKVQERKFWLAIVLGQCTFLLILIVSWNTYLSPEWGLAIIGQFIRWAVGIGILVLFSFVLPLKLRMSSSDTFVKSYLNVLLLFTGFVLVGAWVSISKRPDGFVASQDNYANYARALFGKLSGSYWPVLLASLPWLAVAFKALRFEVAEKATDAIVKAAKD